MAFAIPAFFFYYGETRKINAVRISAAGEGLTEPNLNFHFPLEMKMLTSLATQARLRSHSEFAMTTFLF